MRKFLQEFRDFAMKGSVMDLAIGMIIGSAFTGLVTSFIDDIINPIIGVLCGGVDFSNLYVALNGVHYDTLAKAEAAGAPVLKFGTFISAVINFIILAFVIFLMMRSVNKMRSAIKKPEEDAPTTKTCPYCKSEIAIDAVRCPNCTSLLKNVDIDLEPDSVPKSPAKD